MSLLRSRARLFVLGMAAGVAGGRYFDAGSSSLTSFFANVRYLIDPDRPPDEVTSEDRRWADLAAREKFGRGPVGYVGEFPTEFENEMHYYRAAYGLAPTILVRGRAADRVIVDRPAGAVVEPGQP
ncbi:MAG TPA: hypothetical protein VM597_04735 [Gemmataceae bacterium]|jgi:hypothetical protein|nr:hypothetical protein [Gemmataceae bacterium]